MDRHNCRSSDRGAEQLVLSYCPSAHPRRSPIHDDGLASSEHLLEAPCAFADRVELGVPMVKVVELPRSQARMRLARVDSQEQAQQLRARLPGVHRGVNEVLVSYTSASPVDRREEPAKKPALPVELSGEHLHIGRDVARLRVPDLLGREGRARLKPDEQIADLVGLGVFDQHNRQRECQELVA